MWSKKFFIKCLIFIICFFIIFSAHPTVYAFDSDSTEAYMSLLSDSERYCYVAGIISGFRLSGGFGVEEPVRVLRDCTKGMTLMQIDAIAKKYINENPEKWHVGVSGLILTSIFDSCRKNKTLKNPIDKQEGVK